MQSEILERKCSGSGWTVLNSIFMNNKGPSHALKGRTFFFISFAKKFIILITWNTILYYWHVSPDSPYGRLLVLLIFKIFPVLTSFFFFFWFALDDSLRENNKALTVPLHLMNSYFIISRVALFKMLKCLSH